MTSEPEGLSRAYENEKRDPAGYFETIPSIAGHPGVLTGLLDDRAEGNCGLLVGLRDDLVMHVLLTGSSANDACKDVTEVGRVTIDRLKAEN